MADDKKTAEEFKGLTKTMTEGFKSLVAASKERAAQDAAEMAKNTKAVQDSRKTMQDRMAILTTQGLDEKAARHQAQSETAKILRDQKEAIIKNNPALTILAPIKMVADGFKGMVGNAAKQVEERRENFRLQESLLNGINSIEKGIVNVASTFGNAVKEKASAFGGGLKGILSKLLIGGALAAFVAFMNSPYWEKFKTLLQDTIAPALVAVYNNVLKPIWDVGLSAIFALFEDIGVLFEDIGLAITDFKNGDILGGISKLIGGLQTFFINTVDNLITSVVNLFAGLFGLEKTDSVFGAIGGFIDDTWTSIKGFFVDLKDGIVGIFTDPVGTLTSMWNGIVGEGGLLDIIFKPVDLAVNWIMGIFGWSTEDGSDFSLRKFYADTINTVIQSVKDIFALGEETFGDWQIFKFVKGIIDDIISSVTGIFSGDFSAENFANLFGSLMDIVYAPVNLAINAVKDIFGFGDPDEPFRLSDFVLETFQKIGDFFKSLLDIDVRGLAEGILPETVVDFLFGKKVDQDSAEFKAMSGLDQAKATGLYDHDRVGNSEINRNLVAGASEKQLQAILDHDDLSDEDRDFVKQALAAKSGASEFSGSGKYEPEKLNNYEKKRRRLERNRERMRGDALNQSSTEAQEERAQAQQNLTLIQQKQGLHPREMAMLSRGGGQVAVPVPIKDTSSAATAATSSGF